MCASRQTPAKASLTSELQPHTPQGTLNSKHSTLNFTRIMKNKEFWKAIIQVVVSILTAALTALGTTSCMKLL